MVDDLNMQNEIDGILKPAVNAPQVSQVVPPIQRTQTYSQFQEPTPVQNKSGMVKALVILVLITAVIAVIYYFRLQLFGVLSYADCMQIEESTKVGLEPKYCVTPEGKIYFENRKLIPTDDTGLEQTFIPNDGPTTNPPN